MDFERRKQLYNQCDPAEALAPDDPRNVDVDAAGSKDGDSGHLVRGERWVDQLHRRIRLSNKPLCELLTGLPGCGKSTEIKRLVAKLEAPGEERLLAVHIDADQRIDLASEVDVADLLATIVEATERRLLEAEGKNPDRALDESYVARLWGWLTTTEVGLKDAEINLADKAKLTLEMKTRPSLRKQVRERVAQHLLSFVEQVRRELELFASRAVEAGYQGGIVVIYDSLEKLRGSSLNYQAVLDSCERVFGQGATYLRLPVHVVYTVPPALLSRTRGEAVHFFPMLKRPDARRGGVRARHAGGESYRG